MRDAITYNLFAVASTWAGLVILGTGSIPPHPEMVQWQG